MITHATASTDALDLPAAVCVTALDYQVGIGSWSIDRGQSACGRAGFATLVTACPQDGDFRQPICEKHLNLVRIGMLVYPCPTCERPALWSPAEPDGT